MYLLFSSQFFSCQQYFHCNRKLALIKTDTHFFPINETLFDFTKHLKLFLSLKFIKKMHKFLRLLEKPQLEAIIHESKLQHLILKVLIWNYFSITEQAYKSSGVDGKTSLLNGYYKSFIKNIVGQVIFISLLVCVAVCCLQFSVRFWC